METKGALGHAILDGTDGAPTSVPASHPDLDSACASLTALGPRIEALCGEPPMPDASAALARLRAAFAGLDVSRLRPRQGLAGLFDSPARRLKTFRSDFSKAATAIDDATDDILRQAKAVTDHGLACDALWIETREALAALNPVDAAEGLRSRAASGLVALRAAQNAQHRLPKAVRDLGDSVQAWHAEWRDALAPPNRGAKVKPDPVRLTTTFNEVARNIAVVEREISAAITRQAELSARHHRAIALRDNVAASPADETGSLQDGTASQA